MCDVTFVAHLHFERPLRNGEAVNQEAETTLTGQFDPLYRAMASLLASDHCGLRPRRPKSLAFLAQSENFVGEG